MDGGRVVWEGSPCGNLGYTESGDVGMIKGAVGGTSGRIVCALCFCGGKNGGDGL